MFSDKYVVEGEIARGGMGVIYKAVHTALNRQVAIKVLHPQYSGDPSFLKRFLREARAMARLDHENIIRVFDVAEEKGSHFIVMEYFAGKDIKQLLMEKGRFFPKEALSISLQVADALSYAHARGIIHRDIKLGNIMVDDNGKAKIADFGIAAATDEMSVTATGQIIGTPEYMSPEQARGEHLDGRSDLYSLGMVIYEMLVGHTAYEGVSRMAIVGKLIYEHEDFKLFFPEGIEISIQNLVNKLLRKKIDERIPDANTLVSKIKELINAIEEPKPSEHNLQQTMVASELPVQTINPLQDDAEGPTVMIKEIPDNTVAVPAAITPQPASSFNEPTTPPVIVPSPPAVTNTSSTISRPSTAETSSRPVTQPDTFKTPEMTPATAPSTGVTVKRKNIYPYVGGIGAVVLLIGIAIYFLANVGEKQPIPHPQVEQRADNEISEIQKIQISIRNVQDNIVKSKAEADDIKGAKKAAKLYQEAIRLEKKASNAFEKGGDLIKNKKYGDAMPVMTDALNLFTEANDNFIKVRENILSKAEKENKIIPVNEKAKQGKQTKVTTQSSPPPPSQASKLISQPQTPQTSPARPALPGRPDIEVVGEILTKFKAAYERRDLQTLQQLTEMSAGRSKFLKQIFNDYDTINVSITDFSLTGESATAVVLLTNLVSKNKEPVSPGEDWKRAKVVIRKDGDKWGKIIW